MADFPIPRGAQGPGSAPGLSRASFDVSSGLDSVARGLVQLGAATMEEASAWNRMNAENEVNEYRRQASESIVELSKRFNEEPNPAQYEPWYLETLEQIKANRPKGRLAGRMYDIWLAQVSPRWHQAVADEIGVRINQTRAANAAQAKLDQEHNFDSAIRDIWKQGGKEAVVKALNDPDFMDATGLTNAEASSRLDQIENHLRAEREQQNREEAAHREQTTRAFYSGIFSGQAGPDTVEDINTAFAAGSIERTDRDRMVELLTNPYPATSDLRAKAEVLRAVERYAAGGMTEPEAEQVLYSNSRKLSASDNQKILEEIIGAQDERAGIMFTKADRLLEDLIRSPGPFGIGYADIDTEVTAYAEGTRLLHLKVKDAQAVGKPLTDMEILTEAYTIGKQLKAQIKAEQPVEFGGKEVRYEEPASLAEFEANVKAIPDTAKAREYYDKWKGKF